MYQERKKLGFETLVSKIRSNLGCLILVNLLFAVPLAASVALAMVLNAYVIKIPVLALPLAIVFAGPFYSGVVVLARDYSRNVKNKKILSTYIKAIKDNGLRFLLWGIIMYLGIVGCYFGFKLYSSMAALFGWIFYVVMFFLFVIAVFFLFLSFTVPLMTVSFELRQKDVYKNSALMTFGEIKNNFFATVGIVVFLAIAILPFILISYLSSLMPLMLAKILLIGYLSFIVIALIPAPCALIISHYLYPDMYAVITGESALEGKNSDPFPDAKQETQVEVLNDQNPKESEPDLEDLRNGDGDEYIFYQGKMIKRKLLLSILEQKEEGNDNE